MDRYVQLINMGGDCCGMGLASEFPEEYEDENTTSRASNQEWVRYDDAQSRIAELEAEVAELKEIVRILARSNMLLDKSLEDAIDDNDTAWNDAIEAVAALADKKYGGMVDGQAILALRR